jgi:hypothetical protein
MKDFPHFMQWAFEGIIAGGIIYGVGILGGLKKSIEELNIKMALVIERMTHHEKAIDKHDERLAKIEERI